MQTQQIKTNVLIVGGGTAGCFAAITLAKRDPALRVLIAEKANIKRSGCLAAGVNALNAYITKGKTPEDYADYAARDAEGIVRYDLLLSMSRRLNHVTEELEKLGLVILKDGNGAYVTRGDRNIKINGENIKPILAGAVASYENITVLNHINITDYLIEGESPCERRIRGAVGFFVSEAGPQEGMLGNVERSEDAVSSRLTENDEAGLLGKALRVRGEGVDSDGAACVILADQVICATGGAAGLYRPNNPGFSRHKMWYSPFNTGAGYAMGIRAGAEMTTFEMRFIALRCKDTIAPTGTIAQGVSAKQTNSLGEVYESKYGLKTSERLYGTVTENCEGRGPCYLDTRHISKSQEEELLKAYLNMAPSQTLKWLESGEGPSEQPVEIEGTEPYVVGGHTASGYWVDDGRRTTIRGLYAAGDVAGGAPQKYVTGALAEGEIAAESVLADRETETDRAPADRETETDRVPTDRETETDRVPADRETETDRVHADKETETDRVSADRETETDRVSADREIQNQAESAIRSYEAFLSQSPGLITVEQAESTMQKIMDEYAGGITKNYRYSERSLDIAEERIKDLQELLPRLSASDMDDLMRIYELRERLTVCRALIVHLRARKETRWHSFAENADHPKRDQSFERYVNSRYENGEFRVIYRELWHPTV